MSEWWTYKLSDFLLFSPRTYYRLLESYNRDVWPWHIVAVLAGVAILVLSVRREERWTGRVSFVLLAVAWVWVAWGFHLQRYSPINWSAKWFAAGFLLQAVLLLGAGFLSRPSSVPTPRGTKVSGLILGVFALLGYPIVERLVGRTSPQLETFGLFPDATAVLTIGALLVHERLNWPLFIIPFIWCGVGSATLQAMGSRDAPVAIVAATIGLSLLVWKTVARRTIATEEQVSLRSAD